MKKVRLITSILLIVTLLLAFSASGYASGNYMQRGRTGSIIDKERLEVEAESNAQYTALLSSMNGKSISNSPYADYYGGAFLNQDGKLVVCIAENAVKNGDYTYDDVVADIREATKNPDVLIQTVKYSFNELLQTQKEILDLCNEVNTGTNTSTYSDDEINALKSINSTCTDEENNILRVRIVGINLEKIESLNKMLANKEYLRFEEGDNASATSSPWKPGRQVNIDISNYGSTGFPVYFSYQGTTVRGFVTAGHAFSSGSTAYRTSGQSLIAIGQCFQSVMSGTVDAALIRITSADFTASGTTYYNNVTLNLNTFNSTPAQNSSIWKEGATTHLQPGTITSTSSSLTYSGVTISDMVETTALNLIHDSGGVVYSNNGYSYVVVGISVASSHTGNTLTAESFLRNYVVKAGNIMNYFNCTLT